MYDMCKILLGKEREGGWRKIIIAFKFLWHQLRGSFFEQSVNKRIQFKPISHQNKFNSESRSSGFTITQEIEEIVATDKCCLAQQS